jgi:hypothetical protein
LAGFNSWGYSLIDDLTVGQIAVKRHTKKVQV